MKAVHIGVALVLVLSFAVPTEVYSTNQTTVDTVSSIELNDTVSDEFEDFEEFKDFDANTDTVPDSCQTACGKSCEGCPNSQNGESSGISNSTIWIIYILLLTVLAGFLVRFKQARSWRALFLLGSVVVIGFIREPCPCMISSFENAVLFLSGADIQWITLLWFIGLIPITYIFGRIFCGWICHLGALQELIYKPGKTRWFATKRAKKYLKITQYILFFALILQLVVQQKIFWCRIDPFLSIFQLMLAVKYEIISGILIAILLVTSLLSYRPFCRGACPVGLILGWVQKIPGASKITITHDACISCKNCSNACKGGAIAKEEKRITIDHQECIMCGECFDTCLKSGLCLNKKQKA